jgi:phage baseplate assembly protein V
LIELGALSRALFPDGGAARLYGVAIGIVTNNKDPEGQARVKVKCPWLGGDHESFWARLVTPMAGDGRGLFLLPEVDDEVVVAFEHGSPGSAFVLGALWNGRDTPPETTVDHRTLKSRSGHIVRLDDSNGDERIDIVDKTGSNRVVIRAAENSITIEAKGDIALKSESGRLTLSGTGIEIKSTAGVTITGAQNVDVKAGAGLTLKGATVDIN